MREHIDAMVEAALQVSADRVVAEDVARHALQAFQLYLVETVDRRNLPQAVAFAMYAAAAEDLAELGAAVSDAARQRRALGDLARVAAATNDPERMRAALLAIAGTEPAELARVISGPGFSISPAQPAPAPNGERA